MIGNFVCWSLTTLKQGNSTWSGRWHTITTVLLYPSTKRQGTSVSPWVGGRYKTMTIVFPSPRRWPPEWSLTVCSFSFPSLPWSSPLVVKTSVREHILSQYIEMDWSSPNVLLEVITKDLLIHFVFISSRHSKRES